MTTTAPTPPQPPINACQRALLALAEGQLDAWHGVDGCTRGDADRVFGATGRPDAPGDFGGLQRYPARGAAVHGVEIWYGGGKDAVSLVWIATPSLGASVDALLGPPEATAGSGLGADVEQRVYATRGLTVHVQRGSSVPLVLGYARTTAAQFLDSSYSWNVRLYEEPPITAPPR